MVLQTEYEFTLPRGCVAEEGTRPTPGIMRLATAADEILPMKDPRVQRNPAYLTVIVLARTVTKLGELRDINPGVIETLFIGDLTYLQGRDRRGNGDGNLILETKCPKRGEKYEMEITTLGE